VRCRACRSWTYLPRPSADEQAARHDSPEYFEHEYFQARRDEKATYLRRCRQIFAQIAQVADPASLKGERLLDVGCDTGSLLAAAAETYGLVPAGVDVAERAVAGARAKGFEVFHGTLEEAPAEYSGFGLVTAVDILEHVVDPQRFLADVFRRMRPGGILYVQTPNLDSTVYGVGRGLCRLTAARPRGFFDRLFPPQHIQYFSAPGLRSLAEKAGFTVGRLGRRILPAADIVASQTVRAGMMALQAVDSVSGREILHCAVLRKPA
jgi:SAM-dependent methyltransferase